MKQGCLKLLTLVDLKKKLGARFIRKDEHCIFDFSNKFGEGWDWTWQIPRADFDKAMTDELQRKGVDISFETEVVHVSFNGTDSVTTVKDKNRSEEHTSELQSRPHLVCRLLLEKK